MGLERLLEETPEAYYWAGFIMADGSFRNEQLKVAVAVCDKDHLESLAVFLSAKIIVAKAKCQSGLFEFASITKRDADSINAVLKKFNYQKNKTINPPNDLSISDPILFISFLIGFIDGDGSIKKDGSLCVGCHKNWQYILTNWFRKAFVIADCHKENESMKIPTAYIAKNRTNLANIIIYRKKFTGFLKQKIRDLKLPALQRKWERITAEKHL